MSDVVAQQITRSATIHLPALLGEVFPLFSPLGERHWEPAWNPTMLYPASGAAQVGTTFTTQHADEPAKVWTIIVYDEGDQEQARISYLNLAPASHLTRIDIACVASGPQATDATISYTLTALTPQGAAHLAQFTEAHYQRYIASWETAISQYLRHGQPLAHPQM